MKEETKKKFKKGLKKGLKIIGTIGCGVVAGVIGVKVSNRNKVIMSKEELSKNNDEIMTFTYNTIPGFLYDKTVKNGGHCLIASHFDKDNNEDAWFITELTKERPEWLDSKKE